MVKKNNKSEPLDLNSLPEQNKKAKFQFKQFISKEDIEPKLKAIKLNTEPINKLIPKSFWKDYF